MADKRKAGIAELEDRALAAVRGKLGCQGTLKVTLQRQEPDAIGRNFQVTSFQPQIEDRDASFRAYQAIGELADKFELVE